MALAFTFSSLVFFLCSQALLLNKCFFVHQYIYIYIFFRFTSNHILLFRNVFWCSRTVLCERGRGFLRTDIWLQCLSYPFFFRSGQIEAFPLLSVTHSTRLWCHSCRASLEPFQQFFLAPEVRRPDSCGIFQHIANIRRVYLTEPLTAYVREGKFDVEWNVQ